jgi:hypothetical protein
MSRSWLFALFAILPVHAEAARLSLAGVANSSQPTQPGTEYTGVAAYGAGILLEFRMVPFVGLELGGLYAPRKFSYSTVTPTVTKYTATATAYEFPALLRFHLGRTLSFGLGGYYAKAKGDIGLDSETNGVKSSQGVTFASQQQSDSDYGIATSLALTMRLAPLTHLLVDGRYLIGLKNNSLAAGGDRKYNDMELLAGLQFGF